MKATEQNVDGIVAQEFRAEKGAVSLFLWRKHAVLPAQDSKRPVLVLVHGSSLSGLTSYDLLVPGRPDYSMMDWFARHGFDVWTLDHEGYGRSTLTEGNSNIATGVEDLKAAVKVIGEETGVEQVHLYGMSSGSLRAASFAAAFPERVSRLVLDAFVWTGEGSPTLAKRREGLAFFQANNRRSIDREFILSIFSRDKEGTTEPEVAEACAQAQMAYSDSVPTGTYLDMTQNLPLVDPAGIKAPTLIVRGEHDGIASIDDLLNFFRLLPNPDKQFAMLANMAHCSSLGRSRHLMWQTVYGFLTLPIAEAAASSDEI